MATSQTGAKTAKKDQQKKIRPLASSRTRKLKQKRPEQNGNDTRYDRWQSSSHTEDETNDKNKTYDLWHSLTQEAKTKQNDPEKKTTTHTKYTIPQHRVYCHSWRVWTDVTVVILFKIVGIGIVSSVLYKTVGM